MYGPPDCCLLEDFKLTAAHICQDESGADRLVVVLDEDILQNSEITIKM
jgi:hypothetical protein